VRRRSPQACVVPLHDPVSADDDFAELGPAGRIAARRVDQDYLGIELWKADRRQPVFASAVGDIVTLGPASVIP
jgi:hypothetical protein